MPDLEIRNLHVSAEDKEILKGVDLDVSKGEIHALMGPNGSGKSTLANVVMGHPGLEISEGTIRFNGEKDSVQYARVAQALGLTPDDHPAEQVASFLEQFQKSLGITQRLRDFGIQDIDLPRLAAKALEDSNHQTNPRKVTGGDFLRLFREVL